MSRKPFSLIRKADELKEAATKYETWLKSDAATKSTSYATQKGKTQNPKTARAGQEAWLYPFGVPRTKGVIISCTVPAATGATAVAGKTETESTLTSTIRDGLVGGADGVKFVMSAKPSSVTVLGTKVARQGDLARANLVDIGGTPENPITSRITGRPYSYRKRNAISCPFGQSTTKEDYGTAKEAIKAAITTTSTRRLYFRAQKDIDIAFVAAP